MLNIGEAIPRYLCMFLSFSCEWRSSVVQARMCKLGRDPLIFLKILVVIGHVCIYWSKVAEGFSVFNAVLFIKVIHSLKDYVNLFSFCTHTYMVNALTRSDFRHDRTIFGSLVAKNIPWGSSADLPSREKFVFFFLHVLRYQYETWHIHQVSGTTHGGRI